MSCTYEGELTAYLDGELAPAARAELDRHLPSCASCRATLPLLRQAVVSLQALPAFEPRPALRREVLSRLDQPPGLWARLTRPWVVLPSFGLVAAAVLAVVLVGRSELPSVEPEQLEIAANMDMTEDYELLGLSELEDVDVVQHLHELEGLP